MHIHILTAITLLLWASPVHAYRTPEQVLQQNQYGTYVPDQQESGDFFAAPDETTLPEKSGVFYTGPKAEYRIQQSKGPHSMLQKYKPAAPTEEQTPVEEPIINEDVTPPAEGQDGIHITIDSRTARLLERLTNPSRTTASVMDNVSASHGGAPLAPTGPATVMAMGTLVGAMAWTMRRARNMERR